MIYVYYTSNRRTNTACEEQCCMKFGINNLSCFQFFTVQRTA